MNDIMKPYEELETKCKVLGIKPPFYAKYMPFLEAMLITELNEHEVVLNKSFEYIIISNDIVKNKLYKDLGYKIIIKGDIKKLETEYDAVGRRTDLLKLIHSGKIVITNDKSLLKILLIEIKADYDRETLNTSTKISIHSRCKLILNIANSVLKSDKIKCLINNIQYLEYCMMEDLVIDSDDLWDIMKKACEIIENTIEDLENE